MNLTWKLSKTKETSWSSVEAAAVLPVQRERQREALRTRVRGEGMLEEVDSTEPKEGGGAASISENSLSVGKVRMVWSKMKETLPRLKRRWAGNWRMRRW